MRRKDKADGNATGHNSGQIHEKLQSTICHLKSLHWTQMAKCWYPHCVVGRWGYPGRMLVQTLQQIFHTLRPEAVSYLLLTAEYQFFLEGQYVQYIIPGATALSLYHVDPLPHSCFNSWSFRILVSCSFWRSASREVREKLQSFCCFSSPCTCYPSSPSSSNDFIFLLVSSQICWSHWFICSYNLTLFSKEIQGSGNHLSSGQCCCTCPFLVTIVEEYSKRPPSRSPEFHLN